jgi:ribonuclease P protein component
VAKQFTLGKNERLKSRKSIEQLFSAGKNFSLPPFRIYYTASDAVDPMLQFGAGVSTRNFKKAVDRNRVKRVTREAWRLQKTELDKLVKEQNKRLNVFLIYTSKELPDYKIVYEKTGKIITRLAGIVTTKK